MSKLATVQTIGHLDLGETVGFQPSVKLNVGDEITLKTQVPANAPAYGKAKVQEVQRRKPHDWVLAIRIS